MLLSNLLFLGTVNAQIPLVCKPNESFKAALFLQYKESLTAFMIQGKNLLTLYVNKQTGSWTIGRTIPEFPTITCLILSGQSYTEENKNAINHI